MRPVARRAWVLVAALILFMPARALAQATLSGAVSDSSGAILPGVTVEATSPALIEKVRSAITDSNGRYQLIDLRPGTYLVTFTLPGFSTVKREGVTLSGAGTTTVNATMTVGQLQETVTVTGEAPMVDTQTTKRQAVMDAGMIAALPTARNYLALAQIVPGTIASGSNANDVGGSVLEDVGGSAVIHGSHTTDQRITLNGLSIMTLQAGGNLGGQIPDVGEAQEVTVDTSSLDAELPSGGVRINFVPRDGGNQFKNSTFFTFSNSSLQGNNFSPELKAAGLGTPNAIKKNWDLDEAFGGPIKRDKIWYWFSSRYNGVENYIAVFNNKNAWDPTKWLYDPDTSSRGVNKGKIEQASLRLTWQVTPRNKIAGTYKRARWCNCPMYLSATRAPEAAVDRRFPRLEQDHLEWTSTVTNKVLVEAVGMHLFERWGNMHLRSEGGSLDPRFEPYLPQMISVFEQSTRMTYRNWTTFNNTAVPNFAFRGAVSYVTGTHSAKVGFNQTAGHLNNLTYNFQPYQYTFNKGVPTALTVFATPYKALSNEDADFGVFGQDRWVIDRFTLMGALRYDMFRTSFPEQQIGAGLLLPNRNFTFPAQKNIDWKDLTYRTGLSWNVRGDGKTAVKLAANKYLLGQTLNGLGVSPNPVNAMVTSATRSWNDVNGNYVPDCVLTNPATNGECGPMNPLFGSTRPGDTFDKDLLTGWGHRPSNWEFSAGIQQQLLPRVSVDFGYFRRIWQNFQVTDNVLVGPADFTMFNMTVPTDPRLPSGGGYTVTGVPNVNPDKFTAQSNYNTLSDKFGKQIEHWNGFDFSVNARGFKGLSLQGGFSTGKTVEDNCEIVAKLPEMLNVSPGGGAPAVWQPAQYCHRETPFLTQAKLFGVYTVPKIDVQLSGTFRTEPGVSIDSNFVANNLYLASNSTLGRPLSGNAANMTLNLVSKNQLYLDRRNQLDLRFGKVLRYKTSRSVISLDLYNALNTNVVVSANDSYAVWLTPTEILNARLAKISITFDF